LAPVAAESLAMSAPTSCSRAPVTRFRALALAGALAGLFAATVARPPRAESATLPPGFAESTIAGVLVPTTMAFAPDGRLFVASQTGEVRIIKDGALLDTPFLRVDVDRQGERGLVGLAFDPAFVENGFVYVVYTATTPHLHQRVSRFTAGGDVALAAEQVIWDFDRLTNDIHVSGAIAFGPDGKLYVAHGDNFQAGMAQRLDNLFGKIVRLNPDGTIPDDNPFAATATGKNRAIWALGLRNPFTFVFQPGTGRMLINDVGLNTWEEINEGVAGSNYGWPITEGPTTDPRFRGPIFAYRHGETSTTGCSITGGAFYNPVTPSFPAEFAGTYFFPDFCQGWIRRLDPMTHEALPFVTGVGRIVDLEVSPDGALYILGRMGANGTGPVRRIAFEGPR
jgi:glucose/arabinose dehydrogenase